jgi:very-short-patch-repair endonuclease
MFIVDFCCPARKLVIELDGGIHQQQQGYDRMRSQELNDRGYTVLRFQNDEVMNRLGDVLRRIKERLIEKC